MGEGMRGKPVWRRLIAPTSAAATVAAPTLHAQQRWRRRRQEHTGHADRGSNSRAASLMHRALAIPGQLAPPSSQLTLLCDNSCSSLWRSPLTSPSRNARNCVRGGHTCHNNKHRHTFHKPAGQHLDLLVGDQSLLSAQEQHQAHSSCKDPAPSTLSMSVESLPSWARCAANAHL